MNFTVCSKKILFKNLIVLVVSAADVVVNYYLKAESCGANMCLVVQAYLSI